MKILALDIETTPILGYVWGMWEQNVVEKKENWYILSVAYKWIEGGSNSKVHCITLPDFPGYKKDRSNDKDLLDVLWTLMDEADVLVAHNGDNFDIKKAHARFMFHGMTPPGKKKTVDTLKILKKYAKLDSNRLDAAGDYLGIGRKLQSGGFKTWMGCMNGDRKAWKLMAKYNKQDVELLVKLYEKLKPWITNLRESPNDACPRCKVGRLQKRGTSKAHTMQRYECQDCGKWSSKQMNA